MILNISCAKSVAGSQEFLMGYILKLSFKGPRLATAAKMLSFVTAFPSPLLFMLILLGVKGPGGSMS